MDSQNKWTTIVVSRENRENLRMLGEVPESFNDIIERLVSEKLPMINAIKEAKTKATTTTSSKLLKVSH